MDDVIGATAEATAPPGGIPLVLAPLLSPYRQHGHLSLRVERLQNGARLSKGSNNGDRTWSLTVDDLDGLTYLPPEGMDEAHTLAIRILSLDGEHGATLAVLDLPVSPGDALSGLAPPVAAAPGSDADVDDDVEVRRLRDQLVEVKASLAAREAELAEMRQMLEHARAEGLKQATETDLTAARTAWEAQLKERLAEAAAEAATNLEKSRAAWQAEQEGRFGNLEARAEDRIEQARERWQQEAKAALSKTEATWKADEAVRLAAAEARWREESVRALAEAKARFERAEAALAEARADGRIEQARERWQQEAKAALSMAEATWKANETVRLAAAEARWQKETVRALAEAKARFEGAETALAEARAQAQGDAVELHFLREELLEVKASLALRETELAEARSSTEQSRQGRGAGVGQLQLAERLLAERIESQKDARIADAGGTPGRVSTGQHRPRTGRRLIRAGALLSALAITVMFYHRIEPAIFERWWPKIVRLSTVPERRAVIGTAVAHVRAGPSPAAAVIVTLPRDTEVTQVERRGEWVLVRIGGGDGTHEQEGWVYGPFLKDRAGR